MQILEALRVNDYNPEVKDAIVQLNFQLFNISDVRIKYIIIFMMRVSHTVVYLKEV